MIRRPPISTRTDTRFPYTTLFRSAGFSQMRFKFHGLSQADFDKWVQTGKASGKALYRAAYLQLEQPSVAAPVQRSEEHTSELQSLMRKSYAVFCLKKKK